MILRVLRHMASPPEVTPGILGVDEWAYRRGKSYGTILVDFPVVRNRDKLK